MKKINTVTQILLGIIGLLFALVMVRFPFPANMIAVALFALVFVIYYFVNSYLQKRKAKAYALTFLGQMDEKREDCLQKIRTLKKELKSIDNNIRDLNSKIASNPQASSLVRTETNKLIAGFSEEKSLRQSKINFYEIAQTKLNQIIKNHQLTEHLKRQREKLDAIKETNIDEVADMEGMKTFIDYERTYIETIDELSLEMLKSKSVERAEALQLELVEMTKELREL